MKTLVSFRTSELNKASLIQKAQSLGITVSDLMDDILFTDLRGPKTNELDEKLILIARQSSFLRRRVFMAYKLAVIIKTSKKFRKALDPDLNKLLELITDTFNERKTLNTD